MAFTDLFFSTETHTQDVRANPSESKRTHDRCHGRKMARDMNVLPAVLDMRKEREQMRELWAQGKRCTICGNAESIHNRPYVQDKSEYPEGVPDDLMSLPLCRICLRQSTGETPWDKTCYMICPCLALCDPRKRDPAGTLTRNLRTGYTSLSMYGVASGGGVVTDAVERAGPRTLFIG